MEGGDKRDKIYIECIFLLLNYFWEILFESDDM